MKKLKSNRGITLIALIITIIVMLILVAVTVNIVINSGLLDTAKKSVQDYKRGEDTDNISSMYMGYTIAKHTSEEPVTLSDYFQEQVEKGNIASAEASDEDIIITLANGNSYLVTEDGQISVYHIHTWGEWQDIEGTLYQQRTCSICAKQVKRVKNLEIGAVIEGYRPDVAANGSAISTSYTSAGAQSGGSNADGTSGNGYGDQTFSISSYEWDPEETGAMEWRVLGEDETTGQIIITTADPIQTNAATPADMYFRGMAGYTSFVDELDKISSIYGQGRYADTTKFTNVDLGNSVTINSGARSIDDYDLERIGYTVTRAGLTGTNTKEYAMSAEGKVYKDATVETPVESSYTTFRYWDEHTSSGTSTWKTLSAGESVTLGNHVYSIGGSASTTKAGTMILKKSDSSTDATYWLGSRYLYFASGRVGFGVRYVYNGSVSNYGCLYYSYGNTYDGGAGVRPVVYLQSDINLSYDSTTGVYTIEAGT